MKSMINFRATWMVGALALGVLASCGESQPTATGPVGSNDSVSIVVESGASDLALTATGEVKGEETAISAESKFFLFPSVVNFEQFVSGDIITDQTKRSGVVFGRPGVSAGVAGVDSSDDISFPISGNTSVAGLDANGNIPGIFTGDIYFSFVGRILPIGRTADRVAFTIGDVGGDLDIWEIRAYDRRDNLILTENVSSTAFIRVELSAPGIHRVEVDFDDNNPAGYGFDDLDFQ